jgi:hypothetical protein
VISEHLLTVHNFSLQHPSVAQLVERAAVDKFIRPTLHLCLDDGETAEADTARLLVRVWPEGFFLIILRKI